MKQIQPSSSARPRLGWHLACAVLLVPTLAHAQSFRCGNDLANVGDTKSSVQQKCGEPMARDSFCKPVQQPAGAPGNGPRVVVTTCEPVDEWTYNPGRGQFLTTLRFEAGRLQEIRYGDRVK